MLKEDVPLGIETTPEYIQSMKMRPACDRVLCGVFGVKPDAIERFSREKQLFILDQEFAIDLRVHLPNGTQITGQEKALSYEFYYRHKTFTVEFYQNRNTKEPGEFFKIASQFYLHGYSDESGIDFIDWKIIDVVQMMNWLRHTSVDKLEKRTRPSGGSRASFLPIPYCKIPSAFIIATMV